MSHRRRVLSLANRTSLPNWVLASFATLVGVCSLRHDVWPFTYLPGPLDLHLLFALALCASAAVRTELLLTWWSRGEIEPRDALRRLSRSLYLQIYLVIGISELIDLVRGPVSGHRYVSALFQPAAFELGRLEPTHDLKLLVIYGLAAAVLSRLAAAALCAHKIRDRAPKSAAALGQLSSSASSPPLRGAR
jgi:hypothetical protein